MKNKYSIIMPCYNSSSYVENAIKSIIEQTYDKWELLAINDGSTDDTLDILNHYAKHDKRIIVISKKNGGYVSAVNVGLDNITGNYFLFMGSDDSICCNLLEKHNCETKDDEIDIVCFRTVKVINGIDVGLDRFTSFEGNVLLFNSSLSQFESQYPKHSEIIFSRDTSKIYNTALCQGLRYFGRYGVDSDGIFSMLIAHKAKSFASIPVNGYFWTIREDSLSGRPVKKEINYDRISSWFLFYKKISIYDRTLISKHEIDYIGYYSSIVLSLIYDFCKCNKGEKKLIKRSIKQICYLIKKYDYEKYHNKITIKQKIMFAFPSICSLFLKK